MKPRKFLWFSLIAATILIVLYLIVVFQLPQLIRISQKVGIAPSWPAFQGYLEQRLIGATRVDVESTLRELYPDLKVQKIQSSLDCNYLQMGNGFKYFSYIICYKDNRVASVVPSS